MTHKVKDVIIKLCWLSSQFLLICWLVLFFHGHVSNLKAVKNNDGSIQGILRISISVPKYYFSKSSNSFECLVFECINICIYICINYSEIGNSYKKLQFHASHRKWYAQLLLFLFRLMVVNEEYDTSMKNMKHSTGWCHGRRNNQMVVAS